MELVSINVEGMTCSHCENAVMNALEQLNGVTSVKVDLKAKRVMVEFDAERIGLDTIKGTIEDQGYEVK